MRMSDLSSDVCSSDLTLPTGTYLEWGGQFESLQSASRRMAIVIPIVAVMIFVLLFMALESAAMAAAIFAIVPLAVSGGVFALLLSGQLFSVSAAVGFIVLFGVSVLNGLEIGREQVRTPVTHAHLVC